MEIKNPAIAPFVEGTNLNAHRLYDTPNGEIIHIELKPSEIIPLHSVDADVVFYIVQGKPTIVTENGKTDVEPDTFILSEKGNYHGIENNTDSSVKFLVIKMPKPQLPVKFKDED